MLCALLGGLFGRDTLGWGGDLENGSSQKKSVHVCCRGAAVEPRAVAQAEIDEIKAELAMLKSSVKTQSLA